MGHKRNIEGLLAEKDEKIARLENRIQSYIGRLSLLQSRLLATLDTLDVIQNRQAQERAEFLRNQSSMQARLDEYIKVVRAAELEKNDLQDAVQKLVEKVEASNLDYSLWPRSQIHLSSLAEPMASTQRRSAQIADDKEALSYASALVETLRQERDNERQAHIRTREAGEARILELEARISRRENELEACVTNTGHGDTARETITPRPKARLMDFEADDDNDQIIAMLDDTIARNKVLEREISTLHRRVESARTEAASGGPSDDVPTPQVGPLHLDYSPGIVSPLLLDHGDKNRSTIERSFDHNAFKDLEQQIKLLSDKIDLFSEERNVILQTITLNRPIELERQSHDNLETRLRILENECLGLKASENALRDEFEAAQADAHAREGELLDAINELRLALAANTPATLPPSSNQHQTGNPPDLLDPISDGEMSMELATPLLPFTSIPPASPEGLNQSGPASSSSVPAEGSHERHQMSRSPVASPYAPFPASPQGVVDGEWSGHIDADAEDDDTDSDHDSEPTLSHIIIPMLGTEGTMNFYRATSSFVAELRQVESEIAGAQVQLDVGETALDRIEDIVHDLEPP